MTAATASQSLFVRLKSPPLRIDDIAGEGNQPADCVQADNYGAGSDEDGFNHDSSFTVPLP